MEENIHIDDLEANKLPVCYFYQYNNQQNIMHCIYVVVVY